MGTQNEFTNPHGSPSTQELITKREDRTQVGIKGVPKNADDLLRIKYADVPKNADDFGPKNADDFQKIP